MFTRTNFYIECVERSLKPVVGDKFVQFLDNISGQTTEEFKQKVSGIGDVCWYSVSEATGIRQSVDAESKTRAF